MNTTRDEMLSFIKAVNPSAASRLDSLIDKKKDLIEKGNVYGEKYSERRYWLLVDPIIKSEYKRCRILKAVKDKALSVREVAKELDLPNKEVLQHITALRRRNLVAQDRIEGTSIKYIAIKEEGEST